MLDLLVFLVLGVVLTRLVVVYGKQLERREGTADLDIDEDDGS